jgi:hypothetical protein
MRLIKTKVKSPKAYVTKADLAIMFRSFDLLVTNIIWLSGVEVVVIVWYLDLQPPMQSGRNTTDVVSSNPAQAMCTRYSIMW